MVKGKKGIPQTLRKRRQVGRLVQNSRSGDAADQQVVCVCTPCSAAWSAVAILFVSRLADGDDNVVRWVVLPIRAA